MTLLSNLAPAHCVSRIFVGCALTASLLTACAEDAPKTRGTDNAGTDEGEDEGGDDATADVDAGRRMDGGAKDAGPKSGDAGTTDAGSDEGVDAGGMDAGAADAGNSDAGNSDAGNSDAGKTDGGNSDAGKTDGGKTDAGQPDADSGVGPSGDLCHLEGAEVGILGDSYIALSGAFTAELQNKARAAKALDANEVYVDRAVSGASMNGLLLNIPAQFPLAQSGSRFLGADGLKLVIMTGGGNDVLIDNRPCLGAKSVAEVETMPSCVATVENAMNTAQKLFDTAVEAGVKASIYFFYPHLPQNSALAGADANNVLDYSVPKARELCERQTKAPCYFVDLRPAFNDPANDGWPRAGLIEGDGIHPTLAGSKIMAEEVWKVMQAQCLAVK